MGINAQSPGANDPILAAVIGKAASGKSSFVNAVLGRDLALVGASGIGSCTQHMASYHHLLPDGRDLIIVDTPGFDGYIPLEDGEAPGRGEILKMLEGYLGTRSTASRRRFSYILVLESAQDEEPMSTLTSTMQKGALGRIIEGARVVLVSTHWDLALPENEGEAEEREGALHADDSLSRYLMDTVENIQLRRSGRQDEGDVVPGYISPRDLIFDLVSVAGHRPEKDVIDQAPTVDITEPDSHSVQAAPTTTTNNSLEQVDATATNVVSVLAQKFEEAFSRLKLSEPAGPLCQDPSHKGLEERKDTDIVERLVREAVAREKATFSTRIVTLESVIDGMQRQIDQFQEAQAQKQAKAESSLEELKASLAAVSLSNEQAALRGSIRLKEVPPPSGDEANPYLLDSQYYTMLHKLSGLYLVMPPVTAKPGVTYSQRSFDVILERRSDPKPYAQQMWLLTTENNGKTWKMRSGYNGHYLVPGSASASPADACRVVSRECKNPSHSNTLMGTWKIFRPISTEKSVFIRLVDQQGNLTPWALTVTGIYPGVDKWTGTQEQLWELPKV